MTPQEQEIEEAERWAKAAMKITPDGPIAVLLRALVRCREERDLAKAYAKGIKCCGDCNDVEWKARAEAAEQELKRWKDCEYESQVRNLWEELALVTEQRDSLAGKLEDAERGRDLAHKQMEADAATIIDLDKKLDAAKRLGIEPKEPKDAQAIIDRMTGKRIAPELCAECGGSGVVVEMNHSSACTGNRCARDCPWQDCRRCPSCRPADERSGERK